MKGVIGAVGMVLVFAVLIRELVMSIDCKLAGGMLGVPFVGKCQLVDERAAAIRVLLAEPREPDGERKQR